jgi:hypothetical protein
LRRGDDRLVEDLAAGEVGIQVDVVYQDEVFVVIFGTLALAGWLNEKIVKSTNITVIFLPCLWNPERSKNLLRGNILIPL